MFGFNVLSVIERKGVVGIVCGWSGHHALVMFEEGANGVEFVNYPLSAVARFRVVG